ncbi:Heavy metal-associated isoprenylated plant protein [Melia azedarach]|uniref:Heavy metal-associated isoprenylated plant protein n=1 Tax=Melia azedarach TaxID=155640 RepID=A0ACC1YE78_MELAZ|nr:Heavy metal-associated isoprenylated plant protein [Melia azedarach]
MVPELEKPRITEIKVRMDCNGCVHKIKKALHSINGIYDLYIDFPQQKLTIVGWADPEKIVKAIRKTRKLATICSHVEQTEPSNQPTEQAPAEGGASPNDAANPPPPEPPAAEPPQPEEPPKDMPPPEIPAPPENPPPPPPQNPPPPEVKPSPIAAHANTNQAAGPSGSKDIGEVHIIHHHPPDYGYRYGYGHSSYSGQWNKYQGFPHEVPQAHRYLNVQEFAHEAPQAHRYSNVQGFPQEAPQVQGPQTKPIYVTHSYSTYKPSPYVTEYEYVRSPPPRYAHYRRMDHYSEDYHNSIAYYNTSDGNGNGNGNGNITSIFSDENPNACRIM